MAIFQSSVLKKFLNQLDSTMVMGAYKQYISYFHDAAIQQNIRESKEEQFQAKFLDELFVNILGYTLNPQPNFNLTTEFKNIKNSRKADGAILLNGDAIAVIELKSTKTRDLESIRQQAFDYKANQPGCVYVITSNFEKLRFYINNAVDFEEFDLFAMSYKEFELLYLCLHRTHLLSHTPLKIKEASIHEEEAITKKFYSDYSLFKRELFRDIIKKNLRNPELRDLEEATGKKVLFKKTQKLLDRFLFIFFGEDRGLLPPNSISKILEQYDSLKKMDAYAPLYERYKKYFAYLNEGWKGQDYEIYAYNGGLFKPDPVLDTIIIDDELLYKHTSIFTKYDFESQVDVNILGHIFEHSLNEMESVNAEIDGVEFDKQKTKRKKDGVFYTPKYITKYIVDNTVGKLCQEKKQELDIREEEYFKGSKNRPKTTLIKLDEKLEAYRAWLLELTICDPACGSGAFLNQALEFLIAEHRWIDEMSSKLHGGGLVFPDIENSILEKNIYGVDLNDESVEIAKLSLWLRTALPGRKLTSLNDNIKCGNSLIDVKAVAGDKAFNWEREFPEVFAKGGFDVVIGNPPYGARLGSKEKNYYLDKYRLSPTILDTYLMFIIEAKILLKSSGLLGFIVPSTWMYMNQYNDFRKIILSSFRIPTIRLYRNPIFEDATVETCVCFLINEIPSEKCEYEFIETNELEDLNIERVTQLELLKGENSNLLLKNRVDEKLFVKLSKVGVPIAEITDIVCGLTPYRLGKGKPAQTKDVVDGKLFDSDHKVDETYRRYIMGRDFHRYFWQMQEERWISYGDWLAEPRRAAPFDDDLKIVVRQTSDRIIAHLDENQFLSLKNVHNIRITSSLFDLYFVLGVLNSKLIDWWYQKLIPEKGRVFAEVKVVNLKKLPIPKQKDSQIQELVKTMISVSEKFALKSTSFNNFIASKFDLTILTTKLQSWHELTFAQFITELNAAIKKAGGNKLSKLDEMEWMELFEAKKKEAQELKSEIEKVDREIDGMVYELYGLTEEEVKIVEQN